MRGSGVWGKKVGKVSETVFHHMISQFNLKVAQTTVTTAGSLPGHCGWNCVWGEGKREGGGGRKGREKMGR